MKSKVAYSWVLTAIDYMIWRLLAPKARPWIFYMYALDAALYLAENLRPDFSFKECVRHLKLNSLATLPCEHCPYQSLQM